MKSLDAHADAAQHQPAATPTRQAEATPIETTVTAPLESPPEKAPLQRAALQTYINQSPRLLAQRRAIHAVFGTAIQRQGPEAPGQTVQMASSWVKTTPAKLAYPTSKEPMTVGIHTEAWIKATEKNAFRGTAPSRSERGGIYSSEIIEDENGNSLTACHLLNHDLGGAGVASNMWPHTSQYNSAHAKQQEHHAKAKLKQAELIADEMRKAKKGDPDDVGLYIDSKVAEPVPEKMDGLEGAKSVRFQTYSRITKGNGERIQNIHKGLVFDDVVSESWGHKKGPSDELTKGGLVRAPTTRSRNRAFNEVADENEGKEFALEKRYSPSELKALLTKKEDELSSQEKELVALMRDSNGKQESDTDPQRSKSDQRAQESISTSSGPAPEMNPDPKNGKKEKKDKEKTIIKNEDEKDETDEKDEEANFITKKIFSIGDILKTLTLFDPDKTSGKTNLFNIAIKFARRNPDSPQNDWSSMRKDVAGRMNALSSNKKQGKKGSESKEKRGTSS